MHKPLKLIPIGNSTGVILPKEMLARIKLEKGDAVSVTETAAGYAIRPYEPDFEAKLEASRGRKSVVKGKSVSVRVDLAGRRLNSKIQYIIHETQIDTKTNT